MVCGSSSRLKRARCADNVDTSLDPSNAQNTQVVLNVQGQVTGISALKIKGQHYDVVFAAGGMSYNDALSVYGAGSVLPTNTCGVLG
jgi:hypothetical protein